MKFSRSVVFITVVLVFLSTPAGGHAQDSLGVFHTDPVRFFTSMNSQTWVAQARFMMTNYADTVWVAADSAGRGLRVSRVLVNTDDTVVVSRAVGEIHPETGDSTYSIRWKESRYPAATGRMRWQDGRWVVTFDGAWAKWSIRLRKDKGHDFVATIARTIGSFAPMELADITYRALDGSPSTKP